MTSFDEKDGRAGGWTNAGVYALRPQALDGARLGEASSLERDIFPGLVGRGLNGHVYADASFLDIGTPESLADAAVFVRDHLRPTS